VSLLGSVHASGTAGAPNANTAPAPAAMAASAPSTGSSTAGSPAAGSPGAASTAQGAHHGKSTTVRGEILAKVISIDASAGSMVAKGDDGIERHFVLDTQARQTVATVKPGDSVKVLFDRSVKVTLKPDGEKAQPGMTDNGFDATVTSVNKKAKMITIKGPKGNSFDLDVERAEVLDRVKDNSVVHIEFGRPLGLTVTPA
jgi:hypothetical protein